MEYNVAIIYQVQNEVLADLLDTKDVTYFSDSTARQYKNRKNLFNLCQHISEFGINITWVFLQLPIESNFMME